MIDYTTPIIALVALSASMGWVLHSHDGRPKENQLDRVALKRQRELEEHMARMKYLAKKSK